MAFFLFLLQYLEWGHPKYFYVNKYIFNMAMAAILDFSKGF